MTGNCRNRGYKELCAIEAKLTDQQDCEQSLCAVDDSYCKSRLA